MASSAASQPFPQADDGGPAFGLLSLGKLVASHLQKFTSHVQTIINLRDHSLRPMMLGWVGALLHPLLISDIPLTCISLSGTALGGR